MEKDGGASGWLSILRMFGPEPIISDNPMWQHSSWASQLSETKDLDSAVHADSVLCNCNEISAILKKPNRCEKQSGIV